MKWLLTLILFFPDFNFVDSSPYDWLAIGNPLFSEKVSKKNTCYIMTCFTSSAKKNFIKVMIGK